MNRITPLFTVAILLICPIVLSADEPPDPQKILEAMEKAGKPGEHHKVLEPMVGDWTYTATIWMPGATEPIKMDGTAKRTWIFDGRYIKDEVGSEGPMPFKGFGLMGYDNLRKKYNSMWIDSMSTQIFTSSGTADESGKVLTYFGEDKDPLTGKTVKTRDVIEIHDKDSHTMTAYRTQLGQKEQKVMELKYERKK